MALNRQVDGRVCRNQNDQKQPNLYLAEGLEALATLII